MLLIEVLSELNRELCKGYLMLHPTRRYCLIVAATRPSLNTTRNIIEKHRPIGIEVVYRRIGVYESILTTRFVFIPNRAK
jgi:hypothetical protein